MQRRPARDSRIIALPEQFVTVEIHNHSARKKQRNHRESIIQEMKNTEDLLEETLNRNLRHPKSKFTPNLKNEAAHQSARTFGVRQIEQQKGIKLNSEISRKLKQLSNISRHFDQACEYRRNILPTSLASNEGTYSLPVASPIATPPAERRVKQEMREHKTMVRDWKTKVRQGREFVRRLKLRHPLRLRDVNATKQNEPESARANPNIKSLRDIYFSQLKPQRKTAPVQSNSLQLLFCESKKANLHYGGQIQREPAMKLQKFVEGGQQRQYYEYSNCLNISQFQRSKQKYSALGKVYNHVKEKNLYDFKDMSIDNFDRSTLLSVAYYIENGPNLTEQEKRNFKKKLNIVD